MHQTILIIDYGSQYTQLIARKIRELNVYCVVKPYNKIQSLNFKQENYLGIILSGGPNSVLDYKSPDLSDKILNSNLPVLGICYGLQILCKKLYGVIKNSRSREYGHALISIKKKSLLLEGIKNNNQVWMSHGDHVQKINKNFIITSISNNKVISSIENTKKKIIWTSIPS